MADMPIPTGLAEHGDDDRDLLALGLRAAWLHLHLTGAAGLVLAPREREVLAVVATSPHGVTEDVLLRRLQNLGITAGVAHRVLAHLTHGWLSTRTALEGPLYDLPQEDLDYIANRLRRRAAA